jgi:2,4-dienoyl-CoA reductase-like NADH-dependent reductase (Old Yellow Enzyme family)
MNPKYEPIFEPFDFPCGVQLKNRVLMAPMTTWSGNDDGTVSDAEIAYYRARSQGVGAVITAAAYVLPEGKGFQGQIGAHTNSMIASLKRLATTIQEQGAKAILQIFHGGRLCPPEVLPDGQPVSPSAVRTEEDGLIVSREMSEFEIILTIQSFRDAIRRAIEAGFDGVELHGANAFLVQQFFSPYTNFRSDKWGGSLEKRMTFPLALVDEAINTVAKYAKRPFILGYRFSPEETETPGITMDDTLQLVDALSETKLDYLHISTGDFWCGSLRDENDKKSRSLIVQERIGDRIPVIGVGSIRTADDAIRALETGIPLIALGRELIIAPDWIQKIQDGQEDQIRITLSKNDQNPLVIPDGLWQIIMDRMGWFPVE